MNIASKYFAKEIEKKWYNYWLENNFFHSQVDHREPYTIVIPPPNVTGVLHMGHMLNNTIQDVLIRRARLQGKNACWVPGTDHASIATEAKVVASLKERGIDKNKISREEFLEYAWAWKKEYGGIILEQLKKIGASCDWERTKFTMDSMMSESVIKVFVDLFNKGLIYRGFRMVNWDPQAKTTLSDEEVIYIEKQAKLYYLEYKILDSNEKLIIATTRPETIFGDTAICINPNDERFYHLKNKKAIVPICNRIIPIIEDEYVDIEFGTGCLKVTPAHDQNDKSLGDKHKLDIIDIFNEDASLNNYGMHYQGKDRFVVREEIAKELLKKGILIKTESYINKIGTSERTKAVIEPRLSEQWFLKMENLAKPALENVFGLNKEIKLFPKRFENSYRYWIENIRDWNISRQLLWGQRIPVYYYGKEKKDYVVAESIEKALILVKEKTNNNNFKKEDLHQDKDVLDTWFSSWLWPISVFDGIRNPENDEIKYYYPTNDLVTGPDILFFWVIRMIIAGYEFKDKKPFENVYLTGLVRDKLRRKMSKSLGNSPDALKLIDDYSADGVRVGLLLSSAAGNDLMFDESLCKQGKGFGNKVWSAFYLTSLWNICDKTIQPKCNKIALNWYKSKFNEVLAKIEDHYSKYRLSDVLMSIYKLIYDDFCGWLLEIVKPEYKKPIDKQTYEDVIAIFENNLKILHPFMPFITEEIWQSIKKRNISQALVISRYPKIGEINNELIHNFNFVTDVISGIRTIRKEKNIPFKNSINLSIINKENITKELDSIILKLVNVNTINYVSNKIDNSSSFRVKSNEYFIPISKENINVEIEIEKLKIELKRADNFLIGIQKKLLNKKFINNAPNNVIKLEQKKERDTIAKIETIKTSLKQLNK